MKILGILLIMAGVAALAYGGFTYTTHKRAVDMGPIQIDHKSRHTVPLPPIVGAALLFTSGTRK